MSSARRLELAVLAVLAEDGLSQLPVEYERANAIRTTFEPLRPGNSGALNRETDSLRNTALGLRCGGGAL